MNDKYPRLFLYDDVDEGQPLVLTVYPQTLNELFSSKKTQNQSNTISCSYANILSLSIANISAGKTLKIFSSRRFSSHKHCVLCLLPIWTSCGKLSLF